MGAGMTLTVLLKKGDDLQLINERTQ
jgi:hypothetical protein